MTVKNLLTFDIEDNFTPEELVDRTDWKHYEGQVVTNTESILTLLEKYDAKATFFVLGKVAERRPAVVRMIAGAGHEVASHGYIHEQVARLGRKGFADDVLRSKNVLESISGHPLKGFRAMAFSVNVETAWALDFLREQGFLYDSSILSSHYAEHADRFGAHLLDSFHEVAPSAIRILGRGITFGGGIFFRLVPYSMIRSLIQKENRKQRPVVLYAHAWEFNKDQPHRQVGLLQTLGQSPVTFTTPRRIERLLKEFTFSSVADYLHNSEA